MEAKFESGDISKRSNSYRRDRARMDRSTIVFRRDDSDRTTSGRSQERYNLVARQIGPAVPCARRSGYGRKWKDPVYRRSNFAARDALGIQFGQPVTL
jgi:hypothetical protein